MGAVRAGFRRARGLSDGSECHPLIHGFGLGTGTVAEGWINDAIRFWQHQISGTSGVRSISSNTNRSKGIYALDGTRRDTLQRGINIVNGHKILMR